MEKHAGGPPAGYMDGHIIPHDILSIPLGSLSLISLTHTPPCPAANTQVPIWDVPLPRPVEEGATPPPPEGTAVAAEDNKGEGARATTKGEVQGAAALCEHGWLRRAPAMPCNHHHRRALQQLGTREKGSPSRIGMSVCVYVCVCSGSARLASRPILIMSRCTCLLPSVLCRGCRGIRGKEDIPRPTRGDTHLQVVSRGADASLKPVRKKQKETAKRMAKGEPGWSSPHVRISKTSSLMDGSLRH